MATATAQYADYEPQRKAPRAPLCTNSFYASAFFIAVSFYVLLLAPQSTTDESSEATAAGVATAPGATTNIWTTALFPQTNVHAGASRCRTFTVDKPYVFIVGYKAMPTDTAQVHHMSLTLCGAGGGEWRCRQRPEGGLTARRRRRRAGNAPDHVPNHNCSDAETDQPVVAGYEAMAMTGEATPHHIAFCPGCAMVVGSQTQFPQLHLEVHSNRAMPVDASGFALDTLASGATIDKRAFFLALMPEDEFRVPPGRENVTITASVEITADMVRSGGGHASATTATAGGAPLAYIWMMHLHYHALGTRLVVTKRGGAVLGIRDEHAATGVVKTHSFVDAPVAIRAGDVIDFACTYDSTPRDTVTRGGVPTDGADGEMCNVFLNLYQPCAELEPLACAWLHTGM